jgi:hypothetical protein
MGKILLIKKIENKCIPERPGYAIKSLINQIKATLYF